ncbi:hypothetical protein CkaCkLH20_08960 [Colletotrichum karsti]|uniref:Terpene synthase n=1 Tax=Colletotrichum karsti TaxID=1095194 RepID=A0A9P6I3V0_9PEZI|nr:uncharacterized protein CkaCkLH20_08960 [Colletotrichum karsti]KAF9873501.1 hypothetical protein CkaCkLH20_08960 [Colletotrichum karsti]
MTKKNTDSAELARRLDGQVMVVPDLKGMMSHWPSGKNAHCSDIEAQINEILDRTASAKDKANVMEANPALLASCLWPNASLEQLKTLTQMVLWQGRLDDYIETLEYEDAERAREFRLKTKEYIALYLLLSDVPRDPPTASVVADFQQIAYVMCRNYDKYQRRNLRVSLFDYIDSTISEMRYIQSGEVPTDRYYEDLRKRTAGAGPLCALAEFVAGTQLPGFVSGSTPYKLMLDAVCTIVGLTNDLLSLSKEMRKGRTFNVVPVLLWNGDHGELQEVVEHVVGEIEKCVKSFDVCEARLIRQHRGEAEEIKQVTEALKTICTGNLTWSLESKRYNVGAPEDDGSLRQELRAH